MFLLLTLNKQILAGKELKDQIWIQLMGARFEATRRKKGASSLRNCSFVLNCL